MIEATETRDSRKVIVGRQKTLTKDKRKVKLKDSKDRKVNEAL